MSGTVEGNKKVAAKLKAKYGIDSHGRSVFHAQIGSIGGENSFFFKRLSRNDPQRHKAISAKGGRARGKGNDDSLSA